MFLIHNYEMDDFFYIFEQNIFLYSRTKYFYLLYFKLAFLKRKKNQFFFDRNFKV